MKLYTEKEVRNAIQLSDKYHYILDSEENEIVNLLTPIELPSDEEIDTVSLMISKDRKEFLMGAKYVINKIQGGNK